MSICAYCMYVLCDCSMCVCVHACVRVYVCVFMCVSKRKKLLVSVYTDNIYYDSSLIHNFFWMAIDNEQCGYYPVQYLTLLLATLFTNTVVVHSE